MLTKTELQTLREEIQAALDAIAEAHDGVFNVGNITYDDTSAKIALTFMANGEDGESAEEVEFNKYARAYGFGPADYGKVIFIEGVAYQFYGFAPKARKYPCLLRKVDGQGAIKATLDTVKKHLGL
jgi:hypothetical protein